MALSATQGTLSSFHNNVDDIRNLASCKICLRPFYEPFILTCGHTFCYGCLRNWVCGGESRKKKKSCPECRASIHDPPAPNYALRDLAHIFTDRAELLPTDETLEEHRQGKMEESQLLADDRQGPGLFKNVFKRFTGIHRMPRSIWDPSDGVGRCPACHWELEDGFCSQCGYDAMGDSLDEDFSDEDIDEDDDSFSHGSDISIDIPEGSSVDAEGDGETTGPHGAYETTDASETNTDTDPYPWGYRYQDHPQHLFDGSDEDDEDDQWEDYSDGMGHFIDDGPYPDEEYQFGNGWGVPVLNRHASFDFDEHSYNSGYSEGGYSVGMESDRTSTHNDTDDDASGIDASHVQTHSVDDDESDSHEDRGSTPVPYPVPKRRGHVIISDDEEEEEDVGGADENDDDDDDDDHFEDAVTGHESNQEESATRHPSSTTFNRTLATRNAQTHDDEEDDDDDDDEPIRPAQRSRHRSHNSPTQTARRGGSRAPRSQRGGSSNVQGRNRGYHPYSRPDDAARSGSRYRNSGEGSRGNSRTTYVF